MTGAIYQTFRLPAKCSPFQHRHLTDVFGMGTEMRNVLLESWQASYLWWCEHSNRENYKYLSLSRYDLYRLLTGVRTDGSSAELS